jgi:hypothetical protein
LLQKRIDGVNSKPLEGERPQIESRSLLIAEFINGIDPKPTLHSWSRMSVFGEKADNRYVGAAAKTSYTSADAK